MREITRKYLFMGKLELKTALHIGGGKINLRGTDSPVVLTPENEPFIPGSSFKGAFRSTVEKFVNSIPNLWSCGLLDGDCPTANQEGFIEYRRADENKRRERWDEAKLAQELEGKLCDTCKLFGSPYSASKIYFSDLYVEDWAGTTQIRDGVAIDRDSERAVEGFKYDYEVIPVGSAFKMAIVLENPIGADLGLTCLGLNEFASGMGYIGGMRSRGLGNCRIIDLKGYELDLTDENTKAERLRKYLLGKEVQDKMSEINIENFIQNKIEVLFASAKEE
jgi:CRISPR-associated RAMP protein (TIGR02581 family)